MNDKKQTAVKWFLDKLPHSIETQFSEQIQEALQMEQEQIVDAWNDGDYAYFYSIEGKDFEDGDEYYEEKFGGKDESNH